MLRRDAEPPAERAAETRVLAKTLPGALQRCKGLSRAGNVHTCSTGKVLAVSTFQGSEFPRHKKKERSGTVQKHRGSRRHCAGKLGGAFWEYFSFQEPALVIQIPDSTPRPGFWRTGQFPKTGSGHPESRFRASPRILEPGQISRSRYRHAESRLRASPCDLEIEFDKIQILNSDTAVSVSAPALTHTLHLTNRPRTSPQACAALSWPTQLWGTRFLRTDRQVF